MDENKLSKIKNTEDLLADTENAWTEPINLDEFLFESDCLLESTFNNRFGPIVKGDIIMANNGVSVRKDGISIESPHRVFIIKDAEGEPGHRIFTGYLISSNIKKANYYNKHFPQAIYINNYGSIIQKGPKYDSENFINLADLYIIDEIKISTDSTLWKGHATKEFIDFIDSVQQKIQRGEDTSNIYWIKE